MGNASKKRKLRQELSRILSLSSPLSGMEGEAARELEGFGCVGQDPILSLSLPRSSADVLVDGGLMESHRSTQNAEWCLSLSLRQSAESREIGAAQPFDLLPDEFADLDLKECAIKEEIFLSSYRRRCYPAGLLHSALLLYLPDAVNTPFLVAAQEVRAAVDHVTAQEVRAAVDH
eukprot:gene11558-12941_t